MALPRSPRTVLVLVAVAALAAAGTGTALATPTAPTTSTALVPAATSDVSAAAALTWSDDFNGPAGSPPDAGKWARETGGSGWGNQELEYYTNSTSNAALDGNGNLVITARRENPAGYSCWYGSCQYTSARLTTNGKFTQAYGRFEARIKIPRGQGMWPAFWMLGNNIGSVGWPNSGEIDVMENIGREPGTVHGSLHGPGYSGGNPLTGTYTLSGGRAFADDFHVFAVDWAPGSVAWSVDGVQYLRHTSAETNGNPWVFDHPFFMILNVAVGGNWPGSPDASTSFPQQMVVDYVHVSSSDSGGGGGGTGATGQITGYGGKCVDVAGANSANGTAVQLWDCNGSAAQRWTMATDGTIRALGKCMDVTAGSTANGAQVQLYDCNGTGAQRWTYTAGRDLVNPQANKCLDATGVSSANGTRLQIWDCTGGANQKWTVPAG
ncbi:family 16 glycosylhydrolase [Planosporangium flavigriseum]|uniref:Hydrolase n=1 Tax=Planosporangium flavigriseum TaxID=373681 RepID=A0A8J3PQC5_9ACTN|nr:glycoside hydrolase family 16 protein [Planosporangium flavigriseum]NJC67545.1 family 16 glycosylhydrolase [Planosporangium flavigriseum]GIG75956.1 hydrolase [Planosporangium flavigriseum]